MKPTLLVLAAGMGSRYGGLKQLDPVGPSGETILDYSVYDAIQAGFDKVVFVIRHDFEEAFKERVNKSFAGHIKVEYAFQDMNDLPGGRKAPAERTKPWGTAHAVRAARDVVKAPFAMINADDFYGRDPYVKLASFLSKLSDSRTPQPVESICMAGYNLTQTLSENGSVARGICDVSADKKLITVTEHTKIAREADGVVYSTQPDESKVVLTGNETVSMNFWGFTPALFTLMEEQFGEWLDAHEGQLKAEWYIPLVVNTLLGQKRATVDVLNVDARWFGVTYREDKPTTIAEIRKLIDAGVYPENLWA